MATQQLGNHDNGCARAPDLHAIVRSCQSEIEPGKVFLRLLAAAPCNSRECPFAVSLDGKPRSRSL